MARRRKEPQPAVWRASRGAWLGALVAVALLAGPPSAHGGRGAAAQAGAQPVLSAQRARAALVAIPGVRERSGRMIVRPVQEAELRARGASAAEAAARHAACGRRLQRLDVLRYVPQTDEYVVHVPPGMDEERLARLLHQGGDVAYAEPDWWLWPAAQASAATRRGTLARAAEPLGLRCPDDPDLALQWHHGPARLRSCAAWDLLARATGSLASGAGVSVGICDTGLLVTHEDLLLARLEGYNAVDRLWESQGGAIGPVLAHGTRTTGAAAANGDDGLGGVGIGWRLGHRMLRVSNQPTGAALMSDLQHAARTAVESGDRVANVSYSGASSASNLTTASYVKSIGGLLIWAAGNFGFHYFGPDRDADDLIVVGASDPDDGLWSGSAWGSFVDLVAPGVAIWSTDASAPDAYAADDGTSYAAPLVAGACALVWSARPSLTPDDVEALIKQSATDLGAPGVDDLFGHGRLDLARALELTLATPPIPPTASR